MSVHLGALTRRLVHPTAPVLLTKNGPLSTPIRDLVSIKQTRYLTNSKFENSTCECTHVDSNHSLYLIKLVKVPAILRETSEGTSY